MEMMLELLYNESFMWGAMAILVLCISQLLKLPIKMLTSKIADEKVRVMVNTTIMLIPLALGVLFDFAFCTYFLQTAFSIEEGIKVGATAVTLYGILERIIKGNTSSETEATLELVDDVLEDGKIDKTDISAVERFYNQGK